MRVLRSFGGAGRGLSATAITQLAPADNKTIFVGEVIDVAWMDVAKAAVYRLEITSGKGQSILSALLPAGMRTYRAPSWLRELSGDGVLRLRVIALDDTGHQIAESSWRNLVIK